MKRRELHLPLTCALLGALVAICWGMVHLQSDYDRTRVHLERSLPLAVLGVVCGALVGRVLQRAATARPAIGVLLEATLVPALVAGIAGPVGWLCRDAAEDWSGETAIIR